MWNYLPVIHVSTAGTLPKCHNLLLHRVYNLIIKVKVTIACLWWLRETLRLNHAALNISESTIFTVLFIDQGSFTTKSMHDGRITKCKSTGSGNSKVMLRSLVSQVSWTYMPWGNNTERHSWTLNNNKKTQESQQNVGPQPAILQRAWKTKRAL